MHRRHMITAGLAAVAFTLLAACGGGSSGAALSNTSTCADWNTDVAAKDTTDTNNYVSAALNGTGDPAGSLAAVTDATTQECNANSGENLAAVVGAFVLQAAG